MIENSMDVVRMFCLLFCGPYILIECVLSVAYYRSIIAGCSKIPDSFTNILVYILIILGCISLTVTAFCCYLSYTVGRTVKDLWPQIRHPAENSDRQDTEASLNSQNSSQRNNSDRNGGQDARNRP